MPFSWYEPMWMENLGFAAEGEGWKMTDAGATAMDGDLPVNPSGGVLSSNPIGASGMLRFAEAAMQVRGRPASTRSTAPASALGHAYGGGAQFFAMWILKREQPLMELALTSEQQELQQELREYFARIVTPEIEEEMATGEMGGPKS